MVEVTFYEKPGCSGNARQKQLLAAAGHSIVARDLRGEAWTRVKLLAFFAGLPVSAWFNQNAPAVKSGAIIPEELDELAALALLIDNPLLIRRPLMQVGDERRVGFDAVAVAAWIGLGELPGGEDLEACRAKADETCSTPDENVSTTSFIATSGGGAMVCTTKAEPQHGQACRCGK